MAGAVSVEAFDWSQRHTWPEPFNGLIAAADVLPLGLFRLVLSSLKVWKPAISHESRGISMDFTWVSFKNHQNPLSKEVLKRF